MLMWMAWIHIKLCLSDSNLDSLVNGCNTICYDSEGKVGADIDIWMYEGWLFEAINQL